MPPDTTTVAPQSVAPSGAPASGRPADDLRTLESGLDALQAVPSTEKGSVRRILEGVLPPVLLLAGLVAVWQLYVVIARPRPDLVPGPLDVLGALGTAWADGRLQLAVLTSLERGGVGFLIAVAIGTPLGLLLAEWRPLRLALGPLLSGLQVLPSVAWVPAAIIWFGLSDATVYFVVLMGAVPSIANGLVSGIDQVPPQLRRVGTVLGAGRIQLATLVVLPAALPGYFSGLKQGWAFSWRSLMAAEIIAMGGTIGFGLGSMLQQSRELADLGSVLATILLILGVGILVELAVFAPIERRLLRRRGLTPGGIR
ncbi:NitT/TauT family transport system permease protein [Cryobacterium psychrotolerans]|uniref:NitT/TauT family transport system permease protein n=1 Tax=Cryobacterium psychrotolerans TaxID=386301 RepID=A0A1G9DTI3_9MICO|nr:MULTISPECIES: ABC transporter permease [Cryobacterium]TFD44445.1 ABC transporter permease [Cryobacterium sp. TMT1-2-1]TFD83404.1 ABC transporter permease [Cryobacterium psychrotolerans]SDK67197.1 NitT/TauT family transport system permease protein [Cryobacterium psychrotolerans]